MAVSRLRLTAVLLTLSALAAAGGSVWAVLRFGRSPEDAGRRLEREVRAQIATQSTTLDSIARRAVGRSDLVASAISDRSRGRALFDHLESIQQASPTTVSVMVWVPNVTDGAYRLLAWSNGPAEDLAADLLARAPAEFVVPGNAGLRLVSVQPVSDGDRRIGVVAVDTLLSPAVGVTVASRTYPFWTTYGRVFLELPAGRSSSSRANGDQVFETRSTSGAPLLDVRFDPSEVTAVRRQFWWRVTGAAAAPVCLWLLLMLGALLDERRRGPTFGRWLLQSVAIVAVLGTVAIAAGGLARLAGINDSWILAVQTVAALGGVAALPASAFWRRGQRRQTRRAIGRFVVEQVLAGAAIAGTIAASVWICHHITPATVARWQLPLVPATGSALAELVTLLVAQVAVFWTGVSVAAIITRRWRLTLTRARGWVALAIWALVILWAGWRLSFPWGAASSLVIGLPALALGGLWLRSRYRRSSEAWRLILTFGALVVPVGLVYPVANATANGAVRQLIEREYAPATAAVRQPEALFEAVTTATQEIDAIPELISYLRPLRPGLPVSSQAAFYVWSETNLSRRRLTSEVELYGADGAMVSHFALNFAEFESRAQAGKEIWRGTNCNWEELPDVVRFGSEERPMLHATRALCDASGRMLGAIVLNLVPDYRALPFAGSASPYYEVLGRRTATEASSRIADLEVVVYGWSFQPIFTSGQRAWTITDDTDRRLSQSRSPFWERVENGGRLYEVYFLSDRSGVYALGYPSATAAQHVVRLSEVAAILAVLLVALLTGGTAFSALSRTEVASLRRLIRDIRSSFYRKLFLFFVLAAVGPVVLFALAFGSYMGAKFRADVESEAAAVVTSARRVYEELNAAGRDTDRGGLAPNDDVMVFIRQVIDQDVNLFQGPQLLATSQRDLFDSGLLPTRTPAAAYRDIVLARLPLHLGTDRIGAFEYFVAAAPVVTAGRDTVLSVPLVLRQQEIEHQINDLNRGVLAGVVVVVLFAAALGASVAGRVSDPVARLTRATRLIAAGRLDVRIAADTADELGRLVADFNSMAQTLVSQRAELARTNQLKAWAEMSRQVAHEIKNPLTPIQLAAEHLQRVHQDRQRPLGPVFDQCLSTILKQVRLLRQIASEFSTFAAHPTPRATDVDLADLVGSVVEPYRFAPPPGVSVELELPSAEIRIRTDRTLLSRALTNLVENALQAMPSGGRLQVAATVEPSVLRIDVIDTGVGMDPDAVSRAFEPYFSTKTTGSGLGLANAKRNVELCGGSIALSSAPGAGTTVTVRLPLLGPPDATASA